MKTPLSYLAFAVFFIIPLFGKTQFVTISGKITNELNGEIIENASIFECKSTIGTISDKNGFYKLMLNPGNIDLVISYGGFSDFTQKFKLKSDTTLTVALKPVDHLKSNHKEETKLRSPEKEDKANFRRRSIK